MSGSAPREVPPRGWGGARWVVASLGLLLIVALGIVVPRLQRLTEKVGDGRTPESYGFDLTDPRIDLGRVTASGVAKDGIRSLDSPRAMSGGEVEAFNEEHRGYYLTSRHRVIGVVVGGAARAYPISVLNWHEVINDTIEGIPIAVTFHALCDSAVVLDRRLGDEVLELGVSGLLYSSNLLLYDRRDPAGDVLESLWSQLQGRAVSGPAARREQRLRRLPSSLTRWGDWRAAHPETEVIRPEYSMLERYQSDPYGSFLLGDSPRFPVEPMPPADSLPAMTPVVVVAGGDGRAIYALPEGERREIEIGSLTLELDSVERPYSALLLGDSEMEIVHSLWFAWHAQHPDSAQAELVR